MARFRLMLLVLAMVFACAPLAASSALGLTLDTSTLWDLVVRHGGLQLDCDFRFDVIEGFQLRVPFCVTLFSPDAMYETGVFLVYYPWSTGPFVGMSLMQLGFVSGSSSLDSLIPLNEVVLGWTYEFAGHFYVEPSVVVRDPSGTFSTEYSSLKGVFPCYTTFRVRLALGWKALEL